MGMVWELDENKRILMGYWWEQEELDGNCLGTWWEIKLDRVLKRWADYVYIHVHILSSCPPFFLPADFKERAGRQAGRTQRFHNHVP
jgi:hypothetical protein